jgi:16S rRNA (guanine527-N7)-methyltransferase
MEILLKYFPEMTGEQQEKFRLLGELYPEWNARINVISRKDIPHLYERHILHSLAIAKIVRFAPESRILDVGTGGGMPGIPLAILFPDAEFTLVDSISRKIMVVNEIVRSIDLKNTTALTERAENLRGSWDFIISRAVTAFPKFYGWIRNKISNKGFNNISNGILYLKGGDFEDEIARFPDSKVYNISDYFPEEFFRTKKIIYLPARRKEH